MAKLVVSIKAEGSAFYVTHIIPPCADGTPNAAALAAFLAKAREIEPDGFDPTKPAGGYVGMGAALSYDPSPALQRACELLAALNHDEAEAPNPLNTADTVGPSEG